MKHLDKKSKRRPTIGIIYLLGYFTKVYQSTPDEKHNFQTEQ